MEIKELKKLYNAFPNVQVIKLAIGEALKSNARNLRYVEKVIYSWIDKGLKNEEEVRLFLEEFSAKRRKYLANRLFAIDKGTCYDNDTNIKRKDKGKWSRLKLPEPKRSSCLNDMEGIF